jgi:hypothetical protein
VFSSTGTPFDKDSFTVAFYGLENFRRKTAQSCAMRREFETVY